MRFKGDTVLAVTLTREDLAQAIAGPGNITETRVEALLAFARERVEKTAPDAPDAVANEAVIRFAGYMYGSDFGGIRKEELGPKSVEYVTNHANAWRNSGAAGVLAPWAIKRAGVI